MAQLSRILGSVLRDLVAAQHEANLYALKLSAAYRQGNPAATLSPPAVCLAEVELMLHCGFTGKYDTGEAFEVDRTALGRALEKWSSGLSEMIVSITLSSVAREAGSNSPLAGPVGRLNTEKTLRDNFTAYLSRKLFVYLSGHWAEFVRPDGTIDREVLLESALHVGESEFLAHPEMKSVFAGNVPGALRGKIRESLGAGVRMVLPKLLADVQIGRMNQHSSLEVVVSSEELSKLPDESIQTFRLKISPRDLLSETDAQ